MGRRFFCVGIIALVLLGAGCAAANRGGLRSGPVDANVVSTVVPTDGSFLISLGQTKTAFLQKTGKGYKLVRVENGRQKGKYTVVFTYSREGRMQLLSVMHHMDRNFITYDCYQVKGRRMRQTSIMGAMKDVNSVEIWTDGIKTLLIENIRPIDSDKKEKKNIKAQKTK